MTDAPGARQRARQQITAEIVAAARRQLATEGAAGLSVRAVAREIGMVSSAVYRYVTSRDDLLTLLIIESYDALGAAVEAAAAPRRGRTPAGRFVAAARAVRGWAVRHPHEYALLYGSPVPGYAAPPDTIGPASRPTLALAGIVVDTWRRGRLEPAAMLAVDVPPALHPDLRRAREALDIDLSDETVVALVIAWTQLFGLVSFEVFGQTQNVIDHHAELLDAAAAAMAHAIGLPGRRSG